MQTHTNKPTILITGASGKTGQRIQQQLQALGYTTRGVSRSSTPRFDWNDQSSWHAALSGTQVAYVSYQPDLAVPRAEQDIRDFIDVAKKAGVEHIVMLSGRGETGAQKAEMVLQESGLNWNIVRASWFNQNFSEGFMVEGIVSGQMVLPSSNTLEPFIDVDDIADVAVAVLTKPALINQLFEVTGPELITFTDCVRMISEATGRAIEFIPVPVEAYIEGLKAAGLPEDVQWLMNELFTEVFDGRNANVCDGVEKALGRPATSFSDYVAKTLKTGIWPVATENNTGGESLR